MQGRDGARKGGPLSRWRWEILVLAGALALRLANVWLLRSHPLFEPVLPGYDMTSFHEWAAGIAEGELVPGGPFYQAPLYPYLLAIVYKFAGASPLAAKMFQAVLGAANVLLVMLLARRALGSRAVAITAGVLMAVTPVFLFYEVFLLRVTLVTFLNLALLTALAYFDPRRALVWAALCGALLGLAALGRANILLMLPVGLAWIWMSLSSGAARAKLLAAAVFALITFATISPVTVHNLAHGSRALVSTNMAENWRIGNSEGSNGGFCYPEGGILSPLSADFWLLQGRKAIMLASDYENPNNLNYYLLEGEIPVLRIPLLSWGVFLSFGLAGIWLTRERWRQLFPLYGYLVLVGASLVAFFITSRFRVPLWPVLIIFASAVPVEAFMDALRARLARAASVMAVPLAGAILLVWLNPRTVQPQYYENMVLLHEKRRDREAAEAVLWKKLEEVPDDPSALWQLACYLQLRGESRRSLEMLDSLLELVGDNPEVLKAAGALDVRLGNTERGAGRLERYLELVPGATDSAEISNMIRAREGP